MPNLCAAVCRCTWVCCLPVLLCLPWTASALGPGKVLTGIEERGSWYTYTEKDGLVPGMVRMIYQDRDGFLWLGTPGGGLSRFDGQTFRNYTTEDGLPHNGVHCMRQVRDGTFWIGTRDGVSHFDGQTFTNYTDEDWVKGHEMKVIIEDREGALWFASVGGGVTRYDGETFRTFTLEDGLASLEVFGGIMDRDGVLWFATKFGGVSRYDGTIWTTFTADDGLPNNIVWTVFEDSKGDLWFGCQGAVSRYDGESFENFTTEDGLPNVSIYRIAEDRHGALYVGGLGLYRFEGSRFSLDTITGFVPVLLVDRDGQLWAGNPDGLSRYSDRSVTSFDVEEALGPTWVVPLGRDSDGRLVIGSGFAAAFLRFDGQTWTAHDNANGRVLNGSFLEDRMGGIWLGIRGGGVMRYDGATWETFSAEDGLADSDVANIMEDRAGQLWFATGAGVSRYDGNTWMTFTSDEGLGNNMAHSLFEDRDGNIWVGTQGGGANRYNGKTWTTLTEEDGLVDDRCVGVMQDRDGIFWFSTLYGWSRYDPQAAVGERFTNFDVSDGLAQSVTFTSLQDRRGQYWIGTNGGGVTRYDGQVFQTLTRADGLADDKNGHVFEDTNGDIWIGHQSGYLSRYRQPEPRPPVVDIHTVVADRRYRDVDDLSLATPVGLLSFEFSALSLTSRIGGIVYRYRLRGLEEEWQTTRERRVEYQDLPRGDYVFEVGAVDPDLVYSEQAAQV